MPSKPRETTPWNDPEWFESYVALRDVQAGQIVFWLDSLLDVSVDEKSTQGEQRAAQKAYDFALVARDALYELQAIMRPEVTEPEDEDEDEPATTLDSPASSPAAAEPEDGPTLGEYVARCREVLPRNATAKSGYAMYCLEHGVALSDMSREHAKKAMGPRNKPAPKKRGRPAKKKSAK